MNLHGDDFFKSYFFLPDREVIIDRMIEIDDRKVCLSALTEMAGVTTMWIISEDDSEKTARGHHFELAKTNRESVMQSRLYHSDSREIFIKEIVFGDKVFKVGSASGGRVMEGQGDDAIKVKHFLDQGLSEATLRSFQTCKMILRGYELREGEIFDIFGTDYEGPIRIETSPGHKSISVDKSITLPFGSYEESIEMMVKDPDSDRTYRIHINGVVPYDLWAEKAKEIQTNNQKPDEMSVEDYVEWQFHLEEAYHNLCPKNKVLALMQYEADRKVSLRVHTKNWLNRQIDYKNSKSSGAIGVIFGTDNNSPVGLNGYKLMSTEIEAVDKDFCGKLEVEILDLIETLPGETFKVEATGTTRR